MHGLWQVLGSTAGSVADMVQSIRILPPISLVSQDNHDHGGAEEFSTVHAGRGYVHSQSDLAQYRHSFLKCHSLGAGTSRLAITLAEVLETPRIHSVADQPGRFRGGLRGGLVDLGAVHRRPGSSVRDPV
jgi:hypothetical protein